MNIICKTPFSNGGYPPIQSWDHLTPPEGYAVVPDELDTATFYEHNGFVVLTIEGDTVTGMEANLPAWEAWKASLPPDPEPEPTPQDDTDAMLVDHEYRLTMLELGLTE